MEPLIRQTVVQLVSEVDVERPFDIVARLTRSLPLTMIFRFMGVPQEDWPALRGWGANRLSLGKLEARIALEELSRRQPDLRLVPDQTTEFHPNISFRGPVALWGQGSAARP